MKNFKLTDLKKDVESKHDPALLAARMRVIEIYDSDDEIEKPRKRELCENARRSAQQYHLIDIIEIDSD